MMIKGSIKYFFAMIITLSIFCNSGIADTQDPEDILDKTKIKYATLTTYSDKGYVVSDAGRVEFDSKFKRPNFYLLKWTRKIMATIPQNKKKVVSESNSKLLSNNDGVFTFFNYKDNIDQTKLAYDNIEKAIYASTGSSWAVSIYIPSLFFPNVDTLRITDLVDAEFSECNSKENNEYYIIKGRKPNGQAYELWIEKTTYLIRKIAEADFCYYFLTVETDAEMSDNDFN